MTAASSSAPSAPPLLETRQLTRILPATVPVVLTKDATLRIEDGEMVAITGPSGSGKSSLLYLLGALDAPSSGEVLIRGAPLSEMDDEAKARLRLEQIGFVFQFHFLLPEFSVRENVEIPMRKIARLDRETISARATTILSRLGLGDHTEKQPSQLSGGQRQRVAVARASLRSGSTA
ncbi:MAG: ATP-binding cassette domain-containing protein, partial [Pseudomonadota bacterium]